VRRATQRKAYGVCVDPLGGTPHMSVAYASGVCSRAGWNAMVRRSRHHPIRAQAEVQIRQTTAWVGKQRREGQRVSGRANTASWVTGEGLTGRLWNTTSCLTVAPLTHSHDGLAVWAP
jgi:hypothetical protein